MTGSQLSYVVLRTKSPREPLRSLLVRNLLRAPGLTLTLCLATAAPVLAAPSSVTVVGDFQAELGCTGDWDAACSTTLMAPDADSGVWKVPLSLPAGSWSYLAAVDGSMAETYGQGDGSARGFSLASAGAVTFFFDPVTHYVIDSASDPLPTIPGDFQSELGCPGDWMPDCLVSWLEDPERDGVYGLLTAGLPAGSYVCKVTHGFSWTANYGLGGEPDGANIPFTVDADGESARFRYTLSSHVLAVEVGLPTSTTLAVSPSGPTPVGQPLTLTAQVTATSGVAAGAVELYDGATLIDTVALDGSGAAQASYSPAHVGSVALRARYVPDTGFLSSSSDAVSGEVDAASTQLFASATAVSVTVGEGVMVLAQVQPVAPGSGTPTGKVTLKEGDTVLREVPLDDSGAAALALTFDSTGDHIIEMAYSGDSDFGQSSSSVGIHVSVAASDAGEDAGTPDGGSGTPDAGTPDSGTPDAGTPDGGTPTSLGDDTGGCSASGSSAGALWLALFAAPGLLWLRRRSAREAAARDVPGR